MAICFSVPCCAILVIDRDQTRCKEGVRDAQYSKDRQSKCGRHPNERSEYSKHRPHTVWLSMQLQFNAVVPLKYLENPNMIKTASTDGAV